MFIAPSPLVAIKGNIARLEAHFPPFLAFSLLEFHLTKYELIGILPNGRSVRRPALIKDKGRFEEAIRRFDAINGQDPRHEMFDGKSYPKELLYAQRMTARLLSFAPDAAEEVQLAARCQHIKRWHIPRDNYPKDRKGYKNWRRDLLQFHTGIASEILIGLGYEEESILRVKSLLLKENLRKDPGVQLLEDVICLVFLEYYFEDFTQGHGEEKLVGILRKTWKKMSPAGHSAALALNLPPKTKELITKALQ